MFEITKIMQPIKLLQVRICKFPTFDKAKEINILIKVRFHNINSLIPDKFFIQTMCIYHSKIVS